MTTKVLTVVEIQTLSRSRSHRMREGMICRGIHGYAGVYMDMQGYTWICRGIHGYARGVG